MRLVLIALAMFATSTLAADPYPARVDKKRAQKVEARPNRYLQAAAEAEARDRRLLAAAIDLVSSTRPQFASFMLKIHSDDFARETRVNGQPSVPTYDQLKRPIAP